MVELFIYSLCKQFLLDGDAFLPHKTVHRVTFLIHFVFDIVHEAQLVFSFAPHTLFTTPINQSKYLKICLYFQI